MKSKKIAFIGCSHFSAFNWDGHDGATSWTRQLAEKYPQHEYRNYSEGGRGLEYFEWCLFHVKDWEPDIVFLNRTYRGRWGILGAFDEHAGDKLEWEVTSYYDNWNEYALNAPYIWGTAHGVNVLGHCETPLVERELKQAGDILVNHCYSSDIRDAWETKWYSMATKIYNFPNLFLLHWSPEYSFVDENGLPKYTLTCNIGDCTVVDFLIAHAGVEHEHELYNAGYTLGPEDNHLTKLGHQILLEEFILSQDDVIKALT